MRVQPDPVPPRHTFEDDSSSDGEDDVDPSNRQVSGYQDNDDPDEAATPRKKTETPTIKVNLTEAIQECAATVVGIELLHGVSQWFGDVTQIGDISVTTEGDTVSFPIQYNQEHDIYALSVAHQPPLPTTSDIALKILDVLHPTNLVILTSSTSVPSNIPISCLKTSHRPTAIGGIPADTNPLFSNRGRTTRQDIQARIHAATHPHESAELPLLQPPNMIQGIAAKLMELAEVHGIRATAFVFSTWVGGGLEKRDVEKVVGKLDDLLRGAHVDADDILKSWRKTVGSTAAEKSSIYL